VYRAGVDRAIDATEADTEAAARGMCVEVGREVGTDE
jgi:hypothetical protein